MKLSMPLRAIRQGESHLFPYGARAELAEVDYGEGEAEVMRGLLGVYQQVAPGSREREEALNSLRALHEIKHLLDATILSAEEAALVGPLPGVESEPMTLPGLHRPEPVRKPPPPIQASLLDEPAPAPREARGRAAAAERDNWSGPEGNLPDPARTMVGHYRADGPETMKRAALRQFPRGGSDRLRVLVLFVEQGEVGLTDCEIEQHFRMKHQTASARRRDLVKDGWVAASEQTRKTDTGNDAIVFRVTEAGAAAYAEHARRKVVAA